jgi:hypothetical protein
MYKNLVAFLSLFFFVGCQDIKSQNDAITDSHLFDLGKTYESEWHNFTIDFPSDWEVQEIPDPNHVYFIGPRIDSGEFKVDGSIGITVYQLEEDFTSRYTYDVKMESFRTDPTFKDFLITEEKEFNVDGYKANYVVFTATVGKQATISFQETLAAI